jgi:uncharacterized protein (DUF697 family)
MIVTVRVMDQSLAETVRWLREFRRAKPHRPVLLALTCLHEAYPGSQHPQPDPFVEPLDADQLPDPLRRVLEEHRRLFSGLVDRIVPIDLTRAEEGFRVADFGGDRLRRSVVDLLPAAYRQTFLNFGDATRNLKSLHERRAMPYVIGCSTLAATAAAVPTPWVDIPLVMAIQSHLVYRLHILYGRPIDRSALQRLVAATGVRLLSRLAVRETLKFIPFVGTAANAAVAYAYTFGLGKACCWYFGEVLSGNSPTVDDMKQVWKEQLRTAAGLWKVAPESSGRTLSEAAKGTSLLGERETQGGGG